ncbi:MAG: chemotaxis protein CheB [Acidobacteria bacterium]|nr:chemotaxis protein CheB [Acidobacteriota bacterium]MCG3192210.1 Chemotaxis response regulator protein-glutamate methylesterase of group 1 operon [Thermoanaerobaculia bacterium]
MNKIVRVLVVDDAAFMRRSLIKLLSSDPTIEIAGEASNGREAIEQFEVVRPSVICLDLDMPSMDGLTALKYIMTRRPTPVIIVSSLTGRENVPFETLRLGVIDFFPKPSTQAGDLQEQARHLIYLVRNAHNIRSERLRRVPLTPPSPKVRLKSPCRHLVVIGGTTGSVCGFIRILSLLPPVTERGFSVICQVPVHPAILASFVDSLKNYLGWHVESLAAPAFLHSGTALLVPPASRVLWRPDGTLLAEKSSATDSLDVLFASCGEKFVSNASLILLAGDRADGMAGLRHAASMGASCLVQDEGTALYSTWSPNLEGSAELFDLDHILEDLSSSLLGTPPVVKVA